MSFDDKLVAQFTDFSIKPPSQPAHLKHLYADYVELVSLFSNENLFTVSDFLDRLNDEGVDPIDTDGGDIDEIASIAAEIDDERVSWAISIFDILSYRSTNYEDDYPFLFESPNRIILKTELSRRQKLYLSLLIASNLNIFTNISHDLTSEFESISYHSLKNFLPNSASIKQFGKNSDYAGSAIDKIKNLASDMNIQTNQRYLDNIAAGNNQERGLDLIGWIQFGDKIPNMLTILAQCACGKEWYKKQHETPRYENYLQFYQLKPIHALFIPYSLSNPDNSFYQDDEIRDKLIFCRKRIIEHSGDAVFFEELNSFAAVNKCIELEEDIV